MIVLHPARELIERWGPLAYVDEKERAQILMQTVENRKKAVKRIVSDVAKMKKQKKF